MKKCTYKLNQKSYETCKEMINETERVLDALKMFRNELEKADYWLNPSKYRGLVKHRIIDFKTTITLLVKNL
jgi:hypothetical protein